MHNNGMGPAGVEVAGKLSVRGRVAILKGRVTSANLEFAPEVVAFWSGFDEGQHVVFVTEIQIAVGIDHAGGAVPWPRTFQSSLPVFRLRQKGMPLL